MGFWDRVLGFLGVREEVDEDEYGAEGEELPSIDAQEARGAVEAARRYGQSQGRRGQLVSIPGQSPSKVVVQEPLSFEEVQAVADHVKNRRAVVVCLDRVDRELARKVVDFLSGTAYALDGKIQRVGEGIFLIVPSNVTIEADPRLELRHSRQQAAAAGEADRERAAAGEPGERGRLPVRELLAPPPLRSSSGAGGGSARPGSAYPGGTHSVGAQPGSGRGEGGGTRNEGSGRGAGEGVGRWS
ncbi:MAG TPA: cell division protein SepF [Firmicutes bacterium]|nr:cell division protein SepF [Bacillota bacterium]